MYLRKRFLITMVRFIHYECTKCGQRWAKRVPPDKYEEEKRKLDLLGFPCRACEDKEKRAKEYENTTHGG